MATLSISEVASRLGIDEKDVIDLINKGKIIAIEIGGIGVGKKFLVSEEQVEKYRKEELKDEKPIDSKGTIVLRKTNPSVTQPRCTIENDRVIWLVVEFIPHGKKEGMKEAQPFYQSYLRRHNLRVATIIRELYTFRNIDIYECVITDFRGTIINPDTRVDSLGLREVWRGNEKRDEVMLVLNEI